jgi:hypothetical protein
VKPQIKSSKAVEGSGALVVPAVASARTNTSMISGTYGKYDPETSNFEKARSYRGAYAIVRTRDELEREHDKNAWRKPTPKKRPR